MAFSPSTELEVEYHSRALPVAGSSRPEVLAPDHVVTEAVAAEALAGAVADVVETRPRVTGGR